MRARPLLTRLLLTARVVTILVAVSGFGLRAGFADGLRAGAVARPEGQIAGATVRVPASATVFRQPDVESEALTTIEAETVLGVVNALEDWYVVLVPTGERGVMQIGYLRREDANEPEPVPPPEAPWDLWYGSERPPPEPEPTPEQLAEIALNPVTVDRFDFGPKLGFSAPSGEFVSEVYGGGFSFGGDMYGWTESGFGGGASVEYFRKNARPLLPDMPLPTAAASAEIQVFSVSVPLMYRVDRGRWFPYAGGGPGFTYWKQQLVPTISPDPDLQEMDNLSFAWFVQGGVQFRAWEVWIFIEAKYRADVASAVPPDLNAGGFNLYSGVRF